MAKMIPAELSDYTISDAEKIVFQSFKYSKNTGGWYILHSFHMEDHNQKKESEIDFVVIIPNCGILFLEVKGGIINYHEGEWYSISSQGTRYKIQSPFLQAESYMYNCIENLVKKEIIDKSMINYDYGVMFPNADYDDYGLEYAKERIYSKNNKDIVKYINSLIRYAQSKRVVKDVRFTNEDAKKIIQELRPDITYKVSIDTTIKTIDERIITLTKEQENILFNLLDDNENAFINGVAGSGKTIIALNYAKKCVEENQKVCFLCFNKNLSIVLSNYFTKNNIPIDYVGTFHNKMVVDMDYKIKEEDDLNDLFQRVIPEAYYGFLSTNPTNYDVIIIDEGQDLFNEENMSIFDAMLKKGFNGSKICIFADFEHQRVYTKADKEERKEILKKYGIFVNYYLNKNLRNTSKIIKETNKLTKSNMISLLDGDYPDVKYIEVKTKEEATKKVDELLTKIKNEKVTKSQITILSPATFDKSIAFNLQSKIDQDILSNEIKFSTIKGYKGLESDIVILVDVSSWLYEHLDLLHIAFTRAKVYLYVVESNSGTIKRKLMI